MKIFQPEVVGCCFLCSRDLEDVDRADQWRFSFEGLDDIYWLCRECHDLFPTVEAFDEFRSDEDRLRVFRNASTLRRLLILKAPAVIVAQAVKVIIGGALRTEPLAGYMRNELEKVVRNSNGSTEEPSCS